MKEKGVEASRVTEMSLQGAVGISETQSSKGPCPLASPNKVVEPGGNWFSEDEGLNRCCC